MDECKSSTLILDLQEKRDLWPATGGIQFYPTGEKVNKHATEAIQMLTESGITPPEILVMPQGVENRFSEDGGYDKIYLKWQNFFNLLIRTAEEQLEKNKDKWSPLISLARLCRIYAVDGTAISKKTLSRRIKSGKINVLHRNSTAGEKVVLIRDLRLGWEDIE